jgi:hypothetical protein
MQHQQEGSSQLFETFNAPPVGQAAQVSKHAQNIGLTSLSLTLSPVLQGLHMTCPCAMLLPLPAQ